MDSAELYQPSFRERMDGAQDVARARIERTAYLGPRIVRKRAAMTTDVIGAAAILGVSVQRVRALLGSRRIPGARRIKYEWSIPVENGTIAVLPGKRGPHLRSSKIICSAGGKSEVPF